MLSDGEIWNLLGHKVEVELDTGDSGRSGLTVGHLMTRDPVSQALLIAKMKGTEEIESVEWIPSCSVRNVKPLEEPGTSGNASSICNTFDKLLAENPSTSEDSEENIKIRAEKVVNYLKSHHLEVKENPAGTYTIAGTVRFERPYHTTNLYCDIPLVLKRILKLVEDIEM